MHANTLSGRFKVQGDGGVGPCYGRTEELEYQDAQYETQQGDDQHYLDHQYEPECVLEERTHQFLGLNNRTKHLHRYVYNGHYI